MVVAKVWKLVKEFEGLPKESDFEFAEKELPPLQENEFLCENLYLSVDPYMRYVKDEIYREKIGGGRRMFGRAVGRIIESRSDEYPVGALYMNRVGWTTHFVQDSRTAAAHPSIRILPIQLDQPSLALGILGHTGMTAYYGVLHICKPKEGETLFVNTGAGAVGSVVGQIAKLKGCRVVACAGSDLKVDYMKELGFDGAFNYRTVENIREKITELCPNGIDCFFDNVGGEMFDIVLSQLNRHGRVAVCGSMSTYNHPHPEEFKGPYIHNYVIKNEIKLEGFLVSTVFDRFDVAFPQMYQWLKEGKLKNREHVVNGFENMPRAFIGLFEGFNIGKVVIKP